MYDLSLINGQVYKEDKFINANIYITDGKIAKISTNYFDSRETYDCSKKKIFPGIIDPHTHMELDLGFTTSKDDFFTGSKAAAFGGVTTIIDFLDPVNNVAALKNTFKKRHKQAQKSCIDYKFHACLKHPKNEVDNIVFELENYGLDTVKIFTTYSDSLRRTYDEEIIELLKLTKKHNFILTVHIENDEMIKQNDDDNYQKLTENRPSESETSEALKLAKYVRTYNGKLYMVHLSSGETLKQLKKEYSDILNKDFVIESCPHYFLWNKDIVKSDIGNHFTMAPPLRSEKERKLLFNMIKDVHIIGTDHCPFNFNEKDKELLKNIPLGIGGVEESFRIMYSLFGEEIIPKMTSNVAKTHNLYPQKGIIEEGSDADLFIYDETPSIIDSFHGGADYSLYKGIEVNGQIISTISNGKFVVKDQKFIKQTGKLLNKVGDEYEGN